MDIEIILDPPVRMAKPLRSGLYILGEFLSIAGTISLLGILNTMQNEVADSVLLFRFVAFLISIALSVLVLRLYPAYEKFHNPVFSLRDPDPIPDLSPRRQQPLKTRFYVLGEFSTKSAVGLLIFTSIHRETSASLLSYGAAALFTAIAVYALIAIKNEESKQIQRTFKM